MPDVIYATLPRRFAAAVYDMFISFLPVCVVCAGAFSSAGKDINSMMDKLDGTSILLITLYLVVYEVTLVVSSWRGTIGMRILGLSVQDLKTGATITPEQAVLRSVVFYMPVIGSVLLLVQPLVIMSTKRHQGIQDLLAGTVVVLRTRPAALD
jgi:uncharacterized RDD family membrane protein YckC